GDGRRPDAGPAVARAGSGRIERHGFGRSPGQVPHPPPQTQRGARIGGVRLELRKRLGNPCPITGTGAPDCAQPVRKPGLIRALRASMKVVLLAAGYATRLYPLTLTQPKPLLHVAGRPMIEYVLDNLAPIGGLERVYVVTNARFAGHFQKWANRYHANKPQLDFTVVNDGSNDEADKLGAIGD